MKKRLEKIASILDLNKAENIESFDLTGSEYMVDGVVIATSFVDRHMLSLLDKLKTELKPQGEQFLNIDTSDEWVVVDLGDILVHIMSESARAKYHLEEFLTEFEKTRL